MFYYRLITKLIDDNYHDITRWSKIGICYGVCVCVCVKESEREREIVFKLKWEGYMLIFKSSQIIQIKKSKIIWIILIFNFEHLYMAIRSRSFLLLIENIVLFLIGCLAYPLENLDYKNY